jgi:FAD/FMN-containing dehydrogenase
MMFLKFHVREFKIWVGARGTNRIVAGHTFRNLPKPEEIFVHLIGVRQTEEEEVRSLMTARHADDGDIVAGSMGVVADFNLHLPAFQMMLLEDITVDLLVAANTSTLRRRRRGGDNGWESGGGKAVAAIGKAEEASRWWWPDMWRRRGSGRGWVGGGCEAAAATRHTKE